VALINPLVYALFFLGRRRVIIFSLFFGNILLWCFPSQAQRFELGVGGGVTLYKGDVSPHPVPKFSRPAGSIFIRHNPGKAVSIKYSFMMGKIIGNDKDLKDAFGQARQHSFRSRLLEGSAQLEYNFLNYRNELTKTPLSPYLFGGIAIFRFEPLQNFRPDYNLTQIAIPFGVGLKYVVGGNWNLGLEFGARKTFTDYLDDLGGDINYTNRNRNGNPNDKDMYFYSAVSFSYTFYKVRCPEFY
jgi:hypothetical protein